jgi:hypothetical protein
MSKHKTQSSQSRVPKVPQQIGLQTTKAQTQPIGSKPDKTAQVPKYGVENFSGGTKEK